VGSLRFRGAVGMWLFPTQQNTPLSGFFGGCAGSGGVERLAGGIRHLHSKRGLRRLFHFEVTEFDCNHTEGGTPKRYIKGEGVFYK